MDLERRMERFAETDLYVVITEAFCAGRPAVDVLDAALAAGVGIVQFREKDLTGRELYERCRVFRERTHAAGALLIVDDRLDIALAAGADGVHLGLEDLPVAAARHAAPDLIIGASTHSLDEALEAQRSGSSYVNIGPIFATQTKATPTGAVGPDLLDTIVPRLSIPFTCMGGINSGNIDRVLRRGARHVAVVTAVTAASDPRAAATELRQRMAGYRGTARPGA